MECSMIIYQLPFLIWVQSLDNYHGLYRYYQAEKGDLDYYFIAGPKIKDVVETFSWLTGKTILPPKWSLGYSGSTMKFIPMRQMHKNN